MRQRVLRPRLLGLETEGAARREFRLFEVVHLLVAKGQHALQMRIVGVLRLHRLRHPQHGRCIAAVEGEVLVELDRGEIARPAPDDLCANSLHAGNVTGNPVPQLRDQQGFACVGHASCLGTAEIGRRHRRRGRGLEEHPGKSGIDIGQHRPVIGIGRRHHIGGLGFVGEKAGDEIVDPGERRGLAAAHFISKGILCHDCKSLLSNRSNIGHASRLSIDPHHFSGPPHARFHPRRRHHSL
jgi:hypothetical protein